MAFHLRAARRYPPDGQHSFPCDIYPHHNPPSLHLQPRAARFQDCEGGRESATRLHECPYSVPDAPPCPETGQDGVPETFLAFPRQSPTSGWRQAREDYESSCIPTLSLSVRHSLATPPAFCV